MQTGTPNSAGRLALPFDTHLVVPLEHRQHLLFVQDLLAVQQPPAPLVQLPPGVAQQARHTLRFRRPDLLQGRQLPVRPHHQPLAIGRTGRAVLVCDRYSAYTKLERTQRGQFQLAWCWAHMRRDFWAVARARPDLQGWTDGVLDEIGDVHKQQVTVSTRLCEPGGGEPFSATREFRTTPAGLAGMTGCSAKAWRRSRWKVRASSGSRPTRHWSRRDCASPYCTRIK